MSSVTPIRGELASIEFTEEVPIPVLSMYEQREALTNQSIYHDLGRLVYELDDDLRTGAGTEMLYLGRLTPVFGGHTFFDLYTRSNTNPEPRLMVRYKDDGKVVHDVFDIVAGDMVHVEDEEVRRILLMRRRYLGAPHEKSYFLDQELVSRRRAARLIRNLKAL